MSTEMSESPARPSGAPARPREATTLAPRRAARRDRAREVVAVLARHGIDLAASRLPLRPLRLLRRQPPDDRPPEVHLREALEELGTTFIKLGQVLSTHADLLPPGYLAELSKLQDAGPTVEVGQIEAVIQAELGKPVEGLFADFDRTPLAAASIAQVHAAKLPDGREVVVKVQRPGVQQQVEVDLDILRELGRRLLSRLPEARFLDPERLIEEFSRSIRAELDFTREGRNAELFRETFQDDSAIHIPEVHWELTSRRVITEERLRGIKVDDDSGLSAAGVNRHELATSCTRIIFESALGGFEQGIFHGDPHPGNLLILEGGTLGVLDFGMVGRLDETTRDRLLAVLIGTLEDDLEELIDALERLGLAVSAEERARFRGDISYLLDSYRAQPLSALSIAEISDQTAALLRRYRLRLPSQLSLLIRALVVMEGVGRRLDPDYVVLTAVEPYLQQTMARRLSPNYWGKRLARSTLAGAQLGLDLPIRLERLLGRLERGEQEIGARPVGFEPVLAALGAMVDRLGLSILASGFVLGIAVLLLSLGSEGWARQVIQVLLGLGLLAVFALGTMLAISLRRAGRR